MDKPQLPSFKATQPAKQVALLACILLGGLILATIYLAMAADRVAQQQTQQQGELMAQQVVTLIKPALLSGDPVSLNFVLNQLVKQPHIDAIVLVDTKQRELGRAGDPLADNELRHEITIKQQQQNLAFLEIYLNSSPYLKQISSLLIQAGILSLIIIILTLLTCWYSLNRRDTPAQPALSLTLNEPTDTPEADPVTETEANAPPTTPEPEPEPDIPSLKIAREHDQESEQLIDLLRPADDMPQMPNFAPFSDQKETLQEPPKTAPEPAPVVEDIRLHTQPGKTIKNPLFENEKHEVQLDLYSFEQELELIISAEQAGYLLYLDLASGHSDNITANELQELQEYYARMLDMVIAIYQGETTRTSNGDLQLAFLKPHKDDSHGVNAVCASQLFNRLYKLFNQQRIRRMKPVMNLHMALVRGHHKKLTRLQEEARFLTQSTDSNELITHTALSEAPDLKVSLLAGANLERAEEDKVLIRSVNDNYQKLLDKQARHLLNKLFP